MGAYKYYYEIRPAGKFNSLFRIEPDREVKIAFADDRESLLRLNRMKLLFEQSRIPLSDLHTAEGISPEPRRKKGDNWASTGAPRRIA